MENTLNRLHQRLIQLDPELYIRLQDEGRLQAYFESFFIVPGDPLTALTESIGPSRFEYLADVLEEEFLDSYLSFSSSGILPYELINLSVACAADFDQFSFTENTDSRLLRYAVTGIIADYLEGGQHDI